MSWIEPRGCCYGSQVNRIAMNFPSMKGMSSFSVLGSDSPHRGAVMWNEKARELTDGRGVDCVCEIGGQGTIAMSLKALAVGGHICLIGGSLSPSGTGLDPLLLTGRGITLGSISVGSR